MNSAKLVLNAYYEALYERIRANMSFLVATIPKLLKEELEKLHCDKIGEDKYKAYLDACLAFLDERLEAYNPVGIQYTFDRSVTPMAAELELQLNWYDSRAEFAALVDRARQKAQLCMTEQRLAELADELIQELGAFPDKSIISAYEAEPVLSKLPDYVVAQAIEQLLRY